MFCAKGIHNTYGNTRKEQYIYIYIYIYICISFFCV